MGYAWMLLSIGVFWIAASTGMRLSVCLCVCMWVRERDLNKFSFLL